MQSHVFHVITIPHRKKTEDEGDAKGGENIPLLHNSVEIEGTRRRCKICCSLIHEY